MSIFALLTANGFFLLLVFIVLVLISIKNGNPKKQNSQVKKDIEKIKNQINKK